LARNLLDKLKNMKNYILITLFLHGFFLTATPDFPFPWNQTNDGIQKAIRDGNASALAAYFAPTIELSLPGKKGEVSRIQAEILLKNFFTSYPPVSFSIISEGKLTNDSYFTLGKYQSKTLSFNVYYVIEKKNSQIEMHILKFEP